MIRSLMIVAMLTLSVGRLRTAEVAVVSNADLTAIVVASLRAHEVPQAEIDAAMLEAPMAALTEAYAYHDPVAERRIMVERVRLRMQLYASTEVQLPVLVTALADELQQQGDQLGLPQLIVLERSTRLVDATIVRSLGD